MEDTKVKIKHLAKTVAKGASGTYLGVVGAKVLAGKSMPSLMAKTCSIVKGVGTMHTASTALIQSFAATSIGVPVIVAGTTGTLFYYYAKPKL